MYIICNNCKSKIDVNQCGHYDCHFCDRTNKAIIGEFFSNVYPVVYYISLFYFSLTIAFLLYIIGLIGDFKSLVALCLFLVAFLYGFEGFHLGLSRTMIGIFYKEKNPIFVYFYSMFMWAISFFSFLFL